MMKLKVSLAGIFSVLLVFGLVLVGCSTDDGGSGGGLNLGPLNEEPTGRATIEVTNVALTGYAPNGGYIDCSYDDSTGVWNEFSGMVTAGKLSLTLGTPNSYKPVSELNNDFGSSYDVDTTFEFSDETTRWHRFFGLYGSSGGKSYYIGRFAEVTDNETYYNRSSIDYFYVDKDVIVKRDAISFTERHEDGGPYQDSYEPINLELKKGWNLVQEDCTYLTPTSRAYTVKIATKNVPWSVNSYPEDD